MNKTRYSVFDIRYIGTDENGEDIYEEVSESPECEEGIKLSDLLYAATHGHPDAISTLRNAT